MGVAGQRATDGSCGDWDEPSFSIRTPNYIYYFHGNDGHNFFFPSCLIYCLHSVVDSVIVSIVYDEIIILLLVFLLVVLLFLYPPSGMQLSDVSGRRLTNLSQHVQ